MSKITVSTSNLKTKLIEAAVSTLAFPRPFKMPTMRELAAAAGVAPGAAYRHFASQEALFLSVIQYLFTDLEASLAAATSNLQAPAEKVAAMAYAYVNWGTANPGAYQLILETTDEPYTLENEQRPGLHLLSLLSALMSATGQPTPESTNRATQLWSSLHGIVSLRNHKLGMPWANSAEEQVSDLLRALT